MKIVKKLNKQTKLCNLNNLEFKFKNALNIIFKFHSENKKILFLGTPLKLNKPLKKLFKKILYFRYNEIRNFAERNCYLNFAISI